MQSVKVCQASVYDANMPFLFVNIYIFSIFCTCLAFA